MLILSMTRYYRHRLHASIRHAFSAIAASMFLMNRFALLERFHFESFAAALMLCCSIEYFLQCASIFRLLMMTSLFYFI